MIPLEQQVCSLELARKLKELGVEQNSLFYWLENELRTRAELKTKQEVDAIGITTEHGLVVSAFTVAELEITLPNKIVSIRNNSGTGWILDCPDLELDMTFNADTKANAMARMRIYLLENKHTTT